MAVEHAQPVADEESSRVIQLADQGANDRRRQIAVTLGVRYGREVDDDPPDVDRVGPLRSPVGDAEPGRHDALNDQERGHRDGADYVAPDESVAPQPRAGPRVASGAERVYQDAAEQYEVGHRVAVRLRYGYAQAGRAERDHEVRLNREQ